MQILREYNKTDILYYRRINWLRHSVLFMSVEKCDYNNVPVDKQTILAIKNVKEIKTDLSAVITLIQMLDLQIDSGSLKVDFVRGRLEALVKILEIQTIPHDLEAWGTFEDWRKQKISRLKGFLAEL